MSHCGEEGTWRGVSYQLSRTGDQSYKATISKGKKLLSMTHPLPPLASYHEYVKRSALPLRLRYVDTFLEPPDSLALRR